MPPCRVELVTNHKGKGHNGGDKSYKACLACRQCCTWWIWVTGCGRRTGGAGDAVMVRVRAAVIMVVVEGTLACGLGMGVGGARG